MSKRTEDGDQDTSPSLVVMNPEDRRHVAAAATLHSQLLPESFIPRLGNRFTREFYYAKLGASGLIHCALCVHNGKYVGLVVLTDRPDDFLGTGMRRHFLSLVLEVTWGIVCRPSRLGIVWSVLREKQGRTLRRADAATAEILTFGVVAPYRGRKFGDDQQTIATQMAEYSMARVRDAGTTRMQVVTKQDNVRAIAFYKSQGFEIEDPDYPGDSCLLAASVQGWVRR